MIFWADEDQLDGVLHTNFKLSDNGESLYLSNSDGAIIDQTFFSSLGTDIGYARSPNGTGSFIMQSPTFGFNNDLAEGIEASDSQMSIGVYPSPATSYFIISSDDPSARFDVYNAQGTVIQTNLKPGIQHHTKGWSNGIYILKGALASKRFVVMNE